MRKGARLGDRGVWLRANRRGDGRWDLVLKEATVVVALGWRLPPAT